MSMKVRKMKIYPIPEPTYNIKDKLKSVGCQWDWERKMWYAPAYDTFKKALAIREQYRSILYESTNVDLPEIKKEDLNPKSLERPLGTHDFEKARCFKKGFDNSDDWMKRKTDFKINLK